MDPDAALEEIRRLAAAIDQAGTDDRLAAQLAEELAVATLGLDAWLCDGGFLPSAWMVNRTMKEERR